MRIACALLYCHLWPLWLHHIFRHYLTNGTIFGRILLNIKCVFWFTLQRLSEIFLVLRRTERDIIINVQRSLCKVPVILVTCYCNLNSLYRFSTDIQISDFMKIRVLETELFHGGKETDNVTWPRYEMRFAILQNRLKTCSPQSEEKFFCVENGKTVSLEAVHKSVIRSLIYDL
jgi:hypothetical protein